MLQFREASAPSPDPDSGGPVAQEYGDAGQEGSFLQFRPAEGDESSLRPATGEESSSVQLVQAAPNAPGQKRARESDSEPEDVENLKKRRREDETDGVGDAQVATSEPVALTNEDDIDDAFADAFGENEEDEREREVEEKEGVGDKEDDPVTDSVTFVETAEKAKVLSGGEIDDTLAGEFGDEDGEEEPEDVALPTGTERDSAEENTAKVAGQGAPAKDRAQDGATKDTVKAVPEKELTSVAEVQENKMVEESIDEITPVQRVTGSEVRKVQPNADKIAVGSDAMEIESKAGAKVTQVNGAKNVAAAKEKNVAKDTAKVADAGEIKNAKEVEADTTNVAEKKTDSPVKGSAGDSAKKDAKPKGQPPGIDSDQEEAPLDLAAMSAFEYEQVAKLNPVQLRRYEQYRRSDLKNAKVKKVLVNLNPALQKASEQYIIAVKGLAKLFVGDVVECAIEVKKQMGEKGALQPKHLREAYRRLRRTGVIPSTTDKSTSFS